MVHLLELAPRVGVELAVAGEQVQLLEERRGDSRKELRCNGVAGDLFPHGASVPSLDSADPRNARAGGAASLMPALRAVIRSAIAPRGDVVAIAAMEVIDRSRVAPHFVRATREQAEIC